MELTFTFPISTRKFPWEKMEQIILAENIKLIFYLIYYSVILKLGNLKYMVEYNVEYI